MLDRLFFFTLLLLLPLTFFGSQQGGATGNLKNIIIDTDAGTDDLMAIAFLLSRSDVEIEAITVVNDLAHVRNGAKNILRLLALAGKNEISVLVGEANPLSGSASFPDAWRRNSDQLPGVQLPKTDRLSNPENAEDFLARRFKDSRKCRILALGPLTNIGKALRKSGKTTSAVQSIVVMGFILRRLACAPVALSSTSHHR